jgi:ATP-binding cassette subfamily B (MDR/TAP) protein 7
VVLERHDEVAIKSSNSLAVLNFGQNIIFTSALTAAMFMASQGVVDGELYQFQFQVFQEQ